MLNYFATCAKGLETLLFEELQGLGVHDLKQTNAGCYFRAEQTDGYRVCLWSRLASRVLLQLDKQPVTNRDDLLAASFNIDWPAIFSERATFAVDFRGTGRELTHSQFSARVVKDGIVDRFRDENHARPSVDPEQPDIRINVRLHREQATFYLDLAGTGLHKRGYRSRAGVAPLRETLAAAVVIRAGIREMDPSVASTVLDLFCGSGTLLLEAAQIATNRAPGLDRKEWGFLAWRGHRDRVWEALLADAKERFEQGRESCQLRFVGVDTNPDVLDAAADNAGDLQLEDFCEWRQGDALTVEVSDLNSGLLVTNPPYGERLGDELEVLLLFRQLGQRLRADFLGWQSAILAPEAVLLKRLKLTSSKKYKLYNGSIDVTLALFDINESQVEFTKSHNDDFANRLRKNAQKFSKWAKREGINCYRLYDADLPEYNAAIDVYDDHLLIQEYAAPASVPASVADDRFWHILETVPAVLPFTEQQMSVRQRKRQQGKQQYEKQADAGIEREVQEYNARFKVNLTDYLDSGLFLDHRLVRKEIQKLASHKRVLNLFGYTGTASVHAALGGATHVTTVDMSRTYLNWAKDNFRLNHQTIHKHDFIQADCLQWLQETRQADAERWDLIFLDPPTFSNSKRMQQDSFDVQRDHIDLIADTAALLDESGLLIFSTNKRKFRLDTDRLQSLRLSAEDRTKWSIPDDFARHANIHQCWFIRHA